MLPGAMQRTVSACLAGLVIWRAASDSIVIISSWRAIIAPEVPQRFALYWGHLSHPLAAGTILLLAVLGWTRPKFTQPLVRATCVGLMSFAFCSLWLVPQLIYLSFSKPNTPIQSLRHSRLSTSALFGYFSMNSLTIWFLITLLPVRNFQTSTSYVRKALPSAS